MPVRRPEVDEVLSERRQAGAEHYAAISRLQADGMPPCRITREVGLSQQVVEGWPAASLVDPFRS